MWLYVKTSNNYKAIFNNPIGIEKDDVHVKLYIYLRETIPRVVIDDSNWIEIEWLKTAEQARAKINNHT